MTSLSPSLPSSADQENTSSPITPCAKPRPGYWLLFGLVKTDLLCVQCTLDSRKPKTPNRPLPLLRAKTLSVSLSLSRLLAAGVSLCVSLPILALGARSLAKG